MTDRLTILPQAMNAFSFNRTILAGPHGTIMHKVVHDDLRNLSFCATQSFLCYLIRGQERFFPKDAAPLTMTAGDLVAIPRNMPVKSDFQSRDGPLEAILIFCDDRLLRGLMARRPYAAPRPKVQRVAANAALTTFMQSLVSIYDSLSVNADLVQAKLTELLLLLEQIGDADDLLSRFYDPTGIGQRNLRQLMQHYGDMELPSATLAQITGQSLASFNRAFRRTFGASLRQWQIARRLDRAAQLLLTTNQTVTEIALETGYDSPAYFAEQFRRHLGTTPTQFRIAQRAEGADR